MFAPKTLWAMVGIAIAFDVGATVFAEKILDGALEFLLGHG